MKAFISCLLVYLVLGVSLTHATTISPSYYNWSSTLEVKQPNILGVTAQAQESSTSTEKAALPSSYLRFTRYLFGSELTPTSPFYFIKPLQENVQLLFTFDQKAKEELRIQIAGKRLEEMQKVATSTNTQAITATANAYETAMTALSNNIALVKQNGTADDQLRQLERETAKHNVILEQVRVQVPDQAESAINGALQASWKGTDTIADLKDRPAIPPDLVSRLQSLNSQGLLSSEEVNKLVGVKSRVEARQEVGKYVNEGVVSESDFISLNETTKSFYPDEFYKIHETLRFQELQKLEDQKPDDAILDKIQSFAKIYKPGDQVPPELRKYWVPVVRLEEIQNTLRPDLIDANLFKQNSEESKKFSEVVERFKPRPQDIVSINNLIQKKGVDIHTLPPEYQRMYNLGQRYGAACGTGFNWVPQPQSPAGGYCWPKGSDISSGPKYDDLTKGKICNGTVVSARNANGACSAYPADCLPTNWSKVDTCVATPTSTTGGGQQSCPSNAHFVPISYAPNGGYCIPNYTAVSFDQSTGSSGSACPASSHRSYSGGPCVPDYNASTFNNFYSLPQLTTTPGGPYYTNNGRCGPSANWVPESVNPQGGYCASTQEMSGSSSTSSSSASQEAACHAGGGTCVSWVNGACGCVYSGSGNTNTYVSPSSESQEAACRAGGGTCRSWNNGACGCEYSGSGSTPPSGYGSCGSGLYWNGSSCQTSESPEDACRRGSGCAWTGSACNCSSSGEPAPTSPPVSNTPQEPTSSPTTPP
ncbi:hypothetical protein A3D80_03630 [Candidatus Roizmanbacteria bacterium RIFCSPHIGHO2_02_FULL_40_13b]|uniref:DUF5667 domain-containing protein n=1 Tax=Candidatus Roizmanbacteria bacterium RIFCSPHIGHO2_01_FULL_39_24 TaxID=1802032 RepID=A0A1F7GJ20_9BACT|nr:MAG: hypothetical protein A2799_04180 [Candidatus Roizmanbacteria bacterium RIFCSPHIGHO2_01_FULL_39_24]OGK27055.1 MAG: hypothetical protein A3D80_03630 [Candidatus Roizmanbacteria bacterium RIFCSPHIGHO2_02_FULL_40_13b]OGK48789.1 MAG: hypothetical protein A3A56_01090 [Candidatus Roizmanbacteria bacterium RIFCSPLOWO2_01_FULL_40_32]